MSSDTQADMAVFGFLRIDGHLVHHLRDGLVLQYTSTLYHSIFSLFKKATIRKGRRYNQSRN
ncbi:transmembrane protein [Arabidopsis thaliana]|uniref:Transmembrane protein n=1 Tax=Arabidopsis thaliana TaxID=3702 RepID=Q5XVA6_ARATH|nr:uncharacterized protein AT3G49230 [Arabidopsis thaliana]AAU44486.1 hypothetical protein AT3G49230 [Arabidopsis thaliana]AEE78513.1 transmembrane protein [Arabidopsis thaliana]|eukprot:NP_190492.4 transmembrane protein [Arabidopsis thaliana]